MIKKTFCPLTFRILMLSNYFEFSLKKFCKTFYINKGVETLRIICDNILILLVSAFESYLTSNYNNTKKSITH